MSRYCDGDREESGDHEESGHEYEYDSEHTIEQGLADGKSAQEILTEAHRQGKEIMCAVPINLGTTAVFLNEDGTFGGALKVELPGVRVLTMIEAAHAIIKTRGALIRCTSGDEHEEVISILE